MILAPQTRFNEIVDQLNAVLERNVYANAEDWGMRLLKRECEKVRDVQPDEGWSLLGLYYTLLGDIDQAARSFQASLSLKKNPVTIGNAYASFANLGYYTRAHNFFMEFGKPQIGALSELNDYVDGLGSFQTAMAYNDEAEAMGMDTKRLLDDSFVRAANVLARSNVSDEHVVRHMDAAGEVLRRHKIFYDSRIRFNVSDVEGVFVGVTCIFRIDNPPVDMFELNVELALAEDEMEIQKHPAFDVIFKPARARKIQNGAENIQLAENGNS